MTNHPLISIILPCRNAELHLADCIDSIINQTYTNWELIICDDYSLDSSKEIAESYCKKDSRITSLHNSFGEEPVGITSALKTAYASSNGDYITRMDADDLMPTTKLQILLELLRYSPANKVATGKVSYFPKSEIKAGYYAYQQWLNSLIDNHTHWQDIYKECVIASPAWLMERKTFESLGAFSSAKYPEDYDLVWRMFIGGLEVVSSPEVVHLWRDHKARVSRNEDTYSTQTYFDLKLGYMLSLPSFKDKNIIVWGAGKKGKEIVKYLLQNNRTPLWVCNNPNKIGKEIYGLTLQDCETSILKNPKSIVLVSISNPTQKNEVTDNLISAGLEVSKDFYILT